MFAIRDGKMIDQFEGMLPEDELRAFVDRLAPTEAENALAAAAGLEARDPAAAVGAFRQLFAASPDDPAVRVGLARCLLAAGGSTAEVAALVAPVESGEHADEAARLRTILALRDIPHADADLTAARTAADAAPDSAAAQLRLGQVLAARGDYTAAMDALLAAAAEDKKLGAGAVRELMVNIFTIIGARSPEADDYRDRLRSLLY